MKELTKENKEQILAEDTVVLKYSGSWCAPCRVYNEKLKGLPDDFPIYSVDVDDHPDLAERHNIRGIPATLLIKNGVEVKRLTGIQPIDKVIELIK